MTIKKARRRPGNGRADNGLRGPSLSSHYTTNHWPFATDLPGLLAQAESRKRRAANERGDSAAAMAHLLVWFELFWLKHPEAGQEVQRG